MKIWTFFVIVGWIFMVTGTVKAEEKGKTNGRVSLPSEVAGWKWDEKEITYDPKTLFDYIDGAAELYLAYGFRDLTVRRFEKANQPPVTVELYEMASPEDAYGVFSIERQDDEAGIGQGSELGGGLLRFWKGRFFASVYADGEGAEVESALLKIGRAVADSVPAKGSEPRLIGFIPGKDLGLVNRSVRYLKSHILLNQRFFISHQNVLNLSKNTEAVLAQYLQGEQRTQFLLIRYPDRSEAGAAYQSFMKAYLPDAGGKDRLRTEDRKWTVARQRDEFVYIAFGAPTATDAEALLKATEEKLPRGR